MSSVAPGVGPPLIFCVWMAKIRLGQVFNCQDLGRVSKDQHLGQAVLPPGVEGIYSFFAFPLSNVDTKPY